MTDVTRSLIRARAVEAERSRRFSARHPDGDPCVCRQSPDPLESQDCPWRCPAWRPPTVRMATYDGSVGA